MASYEGVFLCLEWCHISVILLQLFVSQHPVAEGKHEEWSVRELLQDCVIQLFVIDWWLLVDIMKHVVFKAIQNKERNGSNREHDWHTWSKHHSQEDNVQDARVFEVHQVIGS